MDKTPSTKKDFDTEAVMKAKANPTQPQKVVENQVPPTITYFDSAQRIKTDQSPPQRLKAEKEETHQIQEEQPWGANEWGQNGWWANYYGWGTPMSMYCGENMPEEQTKGSYTKGRKSPQAWPNLRDEPGGRAYAKSV